MRTSILIGVVLLALIGCGGGGADDGGDQSFHTAAPVSVVKP
jgi:hypothetical protein